MESQLKRDYSYSSVFILVAVMFASWAAKGGYNLLFVWPSISFSLVGIAYLFGEVRVFGKRKDGSRSVIARILLFPYLLFAAVVLSLQISLSSEPPSSEINESLIISRRLRAKEIPPGTSHICDLTCEFTEPTNVRKGLSYICNPILDAGVAKAEELIALAQSLPPSDKGKLLVHCANGHGRTGMFAAIWLMVYGFASSAAEALKLVKQSRPGVSLRRRQYQIVLQAEQLLQKTKTEM